METIKKNSDFKLTYSAKDSCANRLLVLYKRKNGLEISRLGVSVSKKVGKSNVRNKIKRRIKEIFRLNEDKITKGYDLIFIVRFSCNEATYWEIEEALINLLKRKKLWIRE